jgi:hypothetical protein
VLRLLAQAGDLFLDVFGLEMIELDWIDSQGVADSQREEEAQEREKRKRRSQRKTNLK